MRSHKITIRKSSKSPKYKKLFGVTQLKTGKRYDIPFISFSTFGGSNINNPTKTENRALSFMFENNWTNNVTIISKRKWNWKTKSIRINRYNKAERAWIRRQDKIRFNRIVGEVYPSDLVIFENHRNVA